MAKPSITIERVYNVAACGAGLRYLVDRLWPRGIRKEQLPLDGWLKDVAPSSELRRWFGHDPARWAVFRDRYEAELAARPEAWQPLVEAARHQPVILLFAAKDAEHNHALVLSAYLQRKLPRP